ncbi:LytTR family DNA-binding domain-containing protein [Gymnodinialimonas hymeniacidonis]|uniref:LytTR family DNA-binding domain-containing protein n=1 Tax=Gymnodinialimonas hymeniacidonis TaxID=3126508 RepID=UPI0034C64C5D
MEENSTSVLDRKRDWRIRLSIALLAVVIVSLLGPFSTYDRFSLPERGLYWGAVILGSLIPAHLIRSFLRDVVPGSELKRDVVAVFCIGIVLAPLIWAANIFLLGDQLATPLFLIEHVIIVWLICAIPVLVRHQYRNMQEEPEALTEVQRMPVAVPVEEAPALVRHVEPSVQGPIKRVSADGHQLLIYTAKGEARVRMRFSDALLQLDGADGIQVHRSHWLAFETIKSVTQDGRRYAAILTCGARVPVSPSRLGDLQSAGFSVT